MAGGFWLGGLGITSVLSADLLALSGSDLSLKLEGLQPSVKQLGRKVRGQKMVCLGGVQVSLGLVHKWVERGAGVSGDLNATFPPSPTIVDASSGTKQTFVVVCLFLLYYLNTTVTLQ